MCRFSGTVLERLGRLHLCDGGHCPEFEERGQPVIAHSLNCNDPIGQRFKESLCGLDFTDHVTQLVPDHWLIDELLAELPIVGRINFKRLTADLVERVEVIVRFLAVLELFKQGIVDIEQFTQFGEIDIVWVGDADTDLSVLAIDDYEG